MPARKASTSAKTAATPSLDDQVQSALAWLSSHSSNAAYDGTGRWHPVRQPRSTQKSIARPFPDTLLFGRLNPISNITMTLKARITEDMKDAMRAKNTARLSTIRLLLAAIKQREVDERKDLTDADVLAVIDKMVKQRRDSIAQFEAGKRMDLVAIEQAELEVLHEYLPKQLADAEIDALVAEAIATTGAAGPAGMGKVMAELKPKLAGRADMTAVSAKVKAKLAAG